jgi:hypothetical protein
MTVGIGRSPSVRLQDGAAGTERTLTQIGLAPRHHGRTLLDPRDLHGPRKCVAAIGAIQMCRLQPEQLWNPPGFASCASGVQRSPQRLPRVLFVAGGLGQQAQPVRHPNVGVLST